VNEANSYIVIIRPSMLREPQLTRHNMTLAPNASMADGAELARNTRR